MPSHIGVYFLTGTIKVQARWKSDLNGAFIDQINKETSQFLEEQRLNLWS